MRAVVYNSELRLEDFPAPQPAPGEALVQVLYAGVCNTDVEIINGYMGFHGVLGHEFVGVVESANDPDLIGKRVVGEINCVCHRCRYCLLEMPHHCINRTVLGILNRNGAFADYLALPEENLHIVPKDMPDEVAVFTEPVAAAFRILEQVEISEGDQVVILGDGKLGQVIAQVLAQRTSNIMCIGKHKWKMDLLEARGIATEHFDEFMEPGADVVVEATGSAAGLQRAFDLVRPEGTIVLKTTVAAGTPANMALPVINEVRIVGSRCGPFRPALEALASGSVDVRPLISETFRLDEGVDALKRAQDRDVMKVLVRV